MSTAAETKAAPDADERHGSESASVARRHFLVASIFLVAGLAAWAVTSLQLFAPGFLGGIAPLSYGRLTPSATNSLIFGWAVLGLIGAGYLVIGRNRALWGGRLADFNLVLAAAATLAGIVAVVFGQNQGREHLELPIWADAGVAVALLVAAIVLSRTAASDGGGSRRPAQWYIVAGSWFAALAFAVAAIPGLEGANAALQDWFFAGAFFFGGLVVMAVGLAYDVVGSINPAYAARGRIAPLGFWSLVFVAGWLGPVFGVHGPTPDWLETIGVVFSILLFIPVWTILTDLVRGMRGAWATGGRIETGFLLAGGIGLALLPVLNLSLALRAPAAVLQFTAWEAAFDVVILFAVVSMWMMAFAYRTAGGSTAAGWHMRGTFLGLVIVLGAYWLSGLQQGLTWVGGANARDFDPVGAGFVNSVRPLEFWYIAAFAGVVILLVSQVPFVAAVRRPLRAAVDDGAGDDESAAAELEGPEWEPVAPIPAASLAQRVAALFLLAAVAVFVVPSFEKAHRDASLLGEARDYPSSSAEADGRAVYIREGCWYCHTQDVRPVIADVGLGAVSAAGDYANVTRPLLGVRRVGPDLFNAGNRPPTDSVRWNLGHFERPRTAVDPEPARSWSIMPSYDYLSDSDLDALSLYIASLQSIPNVGK